MPTGDATSGDDDESSLARGDRAAAAGDWAEAEAAFAYCIRQNPHSVRAYIRKAQCRVRVGDDEAARLLLDRAVRLGPFADRSVADADDLVRARTMLSDICERMDSARQTRLRQRGLPSDAWSPRFRHAIDLAAGRRRLVVSDPTSFTYPGLPQAQFYEPTMFEWANGIQDATDAIREELAALTRSRPDDFRAYIQTDEGSGPLGGNAALIDNADWSVVRLCENGWLSPDLIERCPRTWAAVLTAPLPRIAGWGPTVVFSLLKGGARIAAHTGMVNTRLICHLPLVVPPNCRFRVGDEVREWKVGKLMIFDDTVEHEAWNDSTEDRVVLIFDIWRPELSDRERHELTALFSD